jgi:hypothetical protein
MYCVLNTAGQQSVTSLIIAGRIGCSCLGEWAAKKKCRGQYAKLNFFNKKTAPVIHLKTDNCCISPYT